MHVGGKDGDEEGNESPSGEPASFGEEYAESSENLCNAADGDEERRIREPGRDDAYVGRGGHEVHGAGDAEYTREKQAGPCNAEPATPVIRFIFGTPRAIQMGISGTSFDSEKELEMATRNEQNRDREGADNLSDRDGGSVETNTRKDPDQWVTGNESMTGAQASYLKTLSEEAGEPFEDDLTKAEASKKIDELQSETGRGIDH